MSETTNNTPAAAPSVGPVLSQVLGRGVVNDRGTVNRGALQRLVEARRVEVYDAYHFDDMTGSDRGLAKPMECAIRPHDPDWWKNKREGVCYLLESDFRSECGHAKQGSSGAITLYVHSNCNYTLRVVPEGWFDFGEQFRFDVRDWSRIHQDSIDTIVSAFKRYGKHCQWADQSALWAEFCEQYAHWKKEASETAAESKATGAALVSEGASVGYNSEKDGVEIRFAAKPARDVIDRVKAAGFRWSRYSSVWYARYSPGKWAKAHELAGVAVAPEPTGKAEPDRFDMAIEDQNAAAMGLTQEGREAA